MPLVAEVKKLIVQLFTWKICFFQIIYMKRSYAAVAPIIIVLGLMQVIEFGKKTKLNKWKNTFFKDINKIYKIPNLKSHEKWTWIWKIGIFRQKQERWNFALAQAAYCSRCDGDSGAIDRSSVLVPWLRSQMSNVSIGSMSCPKKVLLILMRARKKTSLCCCMSLLRKPTVAVSLNSELRLLRMAQTQRIESTYSCVQSLKARGIDRLVVG